MAGSGNGFLTKDSILAATDLPRSEIAIPEWGGKAFLRVLTGTERDAFETASTPDKNGKRNLKNIRARLVGSSLVDNDGKRLFTDDDIDKLGKKSGIVLDRLFDECMKLNGMSAAGETETEKNSAAAPSVDVLSG